MIRAYSAQDKHSDAMRVYVENATKISSASFFKAMREGQEWKRRPNLMD